MTNAVAAIPTCFLLLIVHAVDTPPAGEPRAVAHAESAEPAPQPITDEDVESVIQRAVEYLGSRQRYNGRWKGPESDRRDPYGLTALAAYTLRAAGTPVQDIRLQRAGRALLDRENSNTVFARSFALLFWCAIDPKRLDREIAEDVHFLELQQDDDGGWGYGTLSDAGPGKKWKDNFHSQLALHALAEAASTGAKVKRIVWRRAERSWLAGANPDGGWGYPITDDPEFAEYSRDSSGSMTAAALASLCLINDRLYLDAALTFNGRFKARCGKESDKTRPIRQRLQHGWRWLNERFRADAIPRLKPGAADDLTYTDLSFYLYSVARAGAASGRKRFGSAEWYPQLARQLVRNQQDDGSWGSVRQTCFAVLALLRGEAPVLINKLRYGRDDAWNHDPRDAANLSRWLNHRHEPARTPVTWQIVDIDSDSNDLGDAPVLLITGHEVPTFDEGQRVRLRDYVHAGGTVLAVACCSREAFVDGCRELFAKTLPHLRVAPLPEDHPIFDMRDSLAPGDDVIGFSDGCRTSVFLLSQAACCAWQQDLSERYQRLFALGGNILRYATFGQPPRGRLTPYIEGAMATVASTSSHPSAVLQSDRGHATPPGWTISVARLRHRGDFWTDPKALRHLSATLSVECGLGIDELPAVGASSARRSKARVLWLTGHNFEPPSANGRLELKSYLLGGGTLIATACCGREAFDETFRPFAASLFGADALQPVPPDDSLITGAFAPELAGSTLKPHLRPRYGAPPPKQFEWPELFGVKRDGRWILVYSPLDITCGISRHACVDCIGYAPRDAEAIARNLLLYVAKEKRE